MVYSIQYTADGGGRVDIAFPFDPYEVLDIKPSASLRDIKIAFRNKINQESRQKRAMVSIASHVLSSSAGRYKKIEGTFTFKPTLNPKRSIVKASSTMVMHFGGHFMLTAAGHTKRLANIISDNLNIVHEEDEHKRTLLYLACKSGFYDTTKLLLKKGADVIKTQIDGSTPLHVAAFYGHKLVVGLLLQHGADTNIKNKWGNTALDESRTEAIKSLIRSASGDCILSLAAKLKEMDVISYVRLVEYQDEVVGKEFVRNPIIIDEYTQEEYDNITESWELVWHGTLFKHVQSILEKGLFPSGTNGITPPSNHVKLGITLFGIDDWAAAIFVSPSIMYSGHAAYAERVLSDSKLWCVLVKAFCKPECYKAYGPTTERDAIKGEPENPEFRVPVNEKNKQVIYRVESARNVVVHSVMFVSAQFLESKQINFKKALKIFA